MNYRDINEGDVLSYIDNHLEGLTPFALSATVEKKLDMPKRVVIKIHSSGILEGVTKTLHENMLYLLYKNGDLFGALSNLPNQPHHHSN